MSCESCSCYGDDSGAAGVVASPPLSACVAVVKVNKELCDLLFKFMVVEWVVAVVVVSLCNVWVVFLKVLWCKLPDAWWYLCVVAMKPPKLVVGVDIVVGVGDIWCPQIVVVNVVVAGLCW